MQSFFIFALLSLISGSEAVAVHYCPLPAPTTEAAVSTNHGTHVLPPSNKPATRGHSGSECKHGKCSVVSVPGSVAPAGSGSVAPVGSGSVAPVGSGTVAPVGSGTVAPVGSGSVPPVGSGSGSVASVGSGSVAPVGSGTVAPVGSGTVAPVGSGSVAPVGSGTVAPVGSGTVSTSDHATTSLFATGSIPGAPSASHRASVSSSANAAGSVDATGSGVSSASVSSSANAAGSVDATGSGVSSAPASSSASAAGSVDATGSGVSSASATSSASTASVSSKSASKTSSSFQSVSKSSSSTVTSAPSVVTSAPAPPASTTQALDAFAQSMLSYHNDVRAIHQVGPLEWDQTLADFAAQAIANDAPTCNFEHTGGPYGENIAIGYGDVYKGMHVWYAEGTKYNYSDPHFSGETGHFTQMVWKSSQKLGCAHGQCANNGPLLVFCEYDPRGNIYQSMGDNVFPPK